MPCCWAVSAPGATLLVLTVIEGGDYIGRGPVTNLTGKLSSNLDWTLSPGSGSGIMLDRTWITVRVHKLAGPGLQVPNQVHRGGGAERGLKNHTGKFTCLCTKMSVMR